MKSSGYEDASTLADVMALIQVLAQSPKAIRTEGGLSTQLRGKPTSKAATWAKLAESHREFFRVRPVGDGNAEVDVALIWRHALPTGDDGDREPLPSESTAKLLELAISLHDREITRSQRFAYLVPIAGVILTGLITIIVMVYKINNNVPV